MSLVHVVGASGRSGVALCRALQAQGRRFVPVVRDAARWSQAGLGGVPRLADLDATDPAGSSALRAALSDAASIVCCAHARYAGAILAAAAPAALRFVFLGSTRKFTRWPDAHGQGVLAGEAAFVASGRRGAMLHPTMIYGAEGEDNVQRLARLLRRLPVVPLPGGGRALVQPIHQDDVTACLLTALDVAWQAPETLVIAGGEALEYRAFVGAVARWAGAPPPRIVPVPAWALMLAARLLRVPGLPRVDAGEVRRLLEDKVFDTTVMQARLGVRPRRLDEGLSLMSTA